MDYRELLKKYIELVKYNEGTDAIDSFYSKNLKEFLNIPIEEWKELCLLADELEEEKYNRDAKF